MSHALSIPAPSQPRGACPTLDVPMQTGDGLLARIRVPERRITPEQLRGLAALASMHGNGQIEITDRGNLQVRGLTSVSAPRFAAATQAILPIERGLVVETPPLAGQDPTEHADPGVLAGAIRREARFLERRLGPKVTVVVDGGGQLRLDSLKADIRLLCGPAGWSIGIGSALPRPVQTNEALPATLAALRRLAALGPESRGIDIASGPLQPAGDATLPLGAFALADTTAIGIALPFGSTSHHALAALATAAGNLGITQLVLAPHHGLLALGADPRLAEIAEGLGFITHPADPRLRVSACIGTRGCASGHVDARALGSRLAPLLPPGKTLHVSGCPKGCAHPRPAEVTLTGNAGRLGLVIDGRAGDTPVRQPAEADAPAALAAVLRQG